MSGRPKGPALSEAEQLREASRAAHEAAQELRAATREAREVLAMARALQDSTKAAIDARAQEIYAEMGDGANRLVLHLQEEAQRVTRHFDQVLEATDSGGMANVIINHAARELAELLRVQIKDGHLRLLADMTANQVQV